MRCRFAQLACSLGLLILAPHALAHAQSGLELRARVALGAGSHESTLPTVNGSVRVAPSAFSALGFELRAAYALAPTFRVGGVVQYASSFGYEISRPIFASARESSAARTQDVGLNALAEFKLGMRRDAWVVPVMLGYGLDAFTTAQPLAAAGSYLLSGPRIAAGLLVPLFDGRISLLAQPELGAVITVSQALRRAGVARSGVEYGWVAEVAVRLPLRLSLGVRYRESHLGLAVERMGSFREVQRFVLGSLTWQNGG